MQELEDKEEGYEILSCGHGMDVIFINLQVCGHLYKIKPVKVPALTVERFIWPHPNLRSYWKLVAVVVKREVVLFGDVATDILSML